MKPNLHMLVNGRASFRQERLTLAERGKIDVFKINDDDDDDEMNQDKKFKLVYHYSPLLQNQLSYWSNYIIIIVK